MTTNTTVTGISLTRLHGMLSLSGIAHTYADGDLVLTVAHGDHVWTVSANYIIYWGDGIDVCKTQCYEINRTSDAYNYIVDVYSKVL